ncbi:MAG: F0F1 ATP synthase subunit B [Bauldia sp.]
MDRAYAAEPTHATTSAEHGGEAKGAFPPFDPSHYASQLVWLAITFIAFYWLLKRLAIPRIAGILDNRKAKIEGDLAEARRAKAESEAAGAAYEKQVADAKARAHAIASKAGEASSAATEAKRSATESALAKKLADAEKRIGDIKTKALSEVGVIAGEATSAVIVQLLGKAASTDEVIAAVRQVHK